MRRTIWSETLPHRALVEKSTLALLSRFSLGVHVAVRPAEVDALPGVLRACAGAGVAASAWPMLDDEDGRWASAANMGKFAGLVERVVSAAAARDVVIDLEPPIADARAVLDGSHKAVAAARSTWRAARAFDETERAVSAAVDALHARGVSVTATVLPLALLDRPHGPPRWQALMGTPVWRPRFDRVNVMLYTSLLEGWSRRLVRRGDARALLAAGCTLAHRAFEGRASVSLGTVGVGAFGDEPTYRGAFELADDVAVARACGIDDLALFDLGGVLSRGAPETWLTAFTSTPPAALPQAPTLRARAIGTLAWCIGRVPDLRLRIQGS